MRVLGLVAADIFQGNSRLLNLLVRRARLGLFLQVCFRRRDDVLLGWLLLLRELEREVSRGLRRACVGCRS
jgi:hypothetical protein